ncbi:2-hydroxymuconic semialdehyde hydrolase [Alcanivorax sp. S71-1-4]|uniref:alpha/beta fold hydrolase n=1 Tax=Alcanivorax sp. S71-1-4 TaxID=1177159 RepID=UPI0013570B0A|nr:alpha/beta hydrolase [Alcanivorax sp. S71-1-4]KAF0808709.1 2-hydroxymuconic semialdehyde hydrolase [Alcanivorax sp. S71-1-4]
MQKQEGIGRSLMAAGHTTNYHEAGEGEALFLLHGSGPGVSGWTNWARSMPAFSDKWRVIVPDIAGFGFTEFRDDTQYDIKLWVAHLVGIMDALDIQKASFIGNSFGGAVAIGLALFAPERVDRLVLLGTPAGEFVQTPGLRGAWVYEPSRENMRALMELFPYDTSLITDELVESRYQASARPGSQDALRKLIPKPKDEGDTLVKGFPAAALSKIKAQTLVVHGREDRVVPPECGMLIAQNVPNADLHLFGHCGHWVQSERAERFVALVRHFLSEPRS